MTDGLALLMVGALTGAGLAVLFCALIALAIAASRRAGRTGPGGQPASDASWNAMPDWVMWVTPDGRVTRSNHPVGSLLAPHAPVEAGSQLSEVYPSTPLPTLFEHMARCLADRQPLRFEFLHEDRYGEARLVPLAEEVLVITRDLTEQKSREERLHRSKERLALAAEGANDGMWDWDLKSNRIYYSYQFKQILHLDAEETHTDLEAWLGQVHPEDRASVHASLHAHIAGETPRYENEHRIVLSDERFLWVLSRGMAVRDASGTAVRVAGSLTDLTNRRAVAVSQEKANLLEYATSSVGIGIVLVTEDRAVRDPSAVMVDMVASWSGVEPWWRALQPTLELPSRAICPECGEPHWTGSTVVETVVPDAETGADPRRFFELCFGGHAHEIGDHSAHVLLVQDVTSATVAEQQLLQANQDLTTARDEALAASRAKSTFLANMSHELRTPLNHIMGYGEMLQEDLEDLDQPQLAEDASRIRTSGLRLLELISAILDLSEIEAGISDAALDRFQIRPVVERVVAAHQERLERQSNHLQQRILSGVDAMVANEDQVTRILGSLLSNAAKFTHEGEVTLEVATSERQGQSWVVFTVSDTGIGMTEEQIRHLWERFYMADASSTRAAGGAGLGLTLAHRFTDMMGGSIDVESVPGEGSTFRVTLPQDGPRACSRPH